MDYRIIEKEAFRVTGRSEKIDCNGNKFEQISSLWDECMADGGFLSLLMPASGELGLMGVCLSFDAEENSFTYMIAIEDSDQAPKIFPKAEIPASTWAVFDSIGRVDQVITQSWETIYQEWFPNSDYKHAGTPDLEVYLPGDLGKDDYKMEIWVPVVAK